MAPAYKRKLDGTELATNRNNSTASVNLPSRYQHSPTPRSASPDIVSTGVSLEGGGPLPIATTLGSASQPVREPDSDAQDVVMEEAQRDRQLDHREELVQTGSRIVYPDVIATTHPQPAQYLYLSHGTFNDVAGNQIIQHINPTEGTGRTLQAIKDDHLAEKIRSWLSSPDSSKNYNDADEKRQPDTCTWFLDGEPFLEWTDNPGFLWIKGKAGSGKSILCSSIINKLSQKNAPFGIAYFFFDGRDSQNALQLHEKLIRSLISQFSHQAGGIPTELADLYKRCGDHQQPSVNQLQKTLRDILDGFPHAYIVIDALDECTDREKTLNWVSELIADTDRNAGRLHILVTSRPERDIEKVFETLHPCLIDVGEANTQQDVMKFLKLQMECKFKECDERTREKIESVLRERADGSFRWVALQLAELEKCSSPDEITKQLAKLPKGLDEIYNRILKKIDEDHRAHVQTFLQWLAFSKRPMTIAEIAETITVDFGSEDGPVYISTKRYFKPQDVLVRCSSLVSESTGTIKLSHFSVKEYLLSDRVNKDFSISEIASHSKISTISVAYLLQFGSFPHLEKAMLDSSPLARYAAEHWIDHAKSGTMDSAPLKLILRLFTPKTDALTNWIRIYNIDSDKYWDRQNLSMDRTEVRSPLYYASLAGLQQVLKHLLENEVDVNAQGGNYGNALQAASYRGHEAIVKLLLENGADVNAQGGRDYGNALQAASYRGHEAIVMLLLEKGADVNAQGGRICSTALQAASSGGHEAIVMLLLEKGADVNAQGGSALQAASFGGHEAIVKLLLEKGADVNAQGGADNSTLQAASYGGHEAIVMLLLEKGADVNAQGGRICSTALQAASSGGHEAIVMLLLEKGADVNAQGGSALQAASYGGHEAIVKLLLEKGADVNAQGGADNSALQAASYGGHEAIVMLLLEKGADVNAQGGADNSALQAASYRGHEAIVMLLLEKGADVNAQGGSALQAASFGGHEAIVMLLLEKGADVNAQGGGICSSALEAASYRGHEAIVMLLLEKGADVNAQGGSALQAASFGGHEAIVMLLLEKGADVNVQGGTYSSALQAASFGGHEAIVMLLLEKGADVNAQGGSALQAASFGGHEAIVKLLLEKGADVNAQGGIYSSALQAVSFAGHEAIVMLLLEKGADVNVQGGTYSSALQAASSGGHEAIVMLLLEKGADVNAQGGSALQAASFGGHEAIVMLLLEKGADVNVQGGAYSSALQAASYRGHEAIVMLLLEKGADVNAQGGIYSSALQAASYGGHEAIVKLLLEKGADMNAQGGRYSSALQAASYGGHEAIVMLLLEKGADVNAQGGRYSSALEAASSGGHEAIVKLLLEKGADMNALEPTIQLSSERAFGHTGVRRSIPHCSPRGVRNRKAVNQPFTPSQKSVEAGRTTANQVEKE